MARLDPVDERWVAASHRDRREISSIDSDAKHTRQSTSTGNHCWKFCGGVLTSGFVCVYPATLSCLLRNGGWWNVRSAVGIR